MGNESGAPVPAREPAVPQRVHVHLVLGLILVPFASAVLGWILAVGDVLRGYGTRKELVWTRLLVALVFVDTLCVMGTMWKMSDPDEFKRMGERLSPPRSQIGVGFEPERPDEPPVVSTLRPGLPAEQAGMAPGDLILEIDGKPVKTQEEAIDALKAGAPGVARKFRVRRADEVRELTVVPAAFQKVGLFQILKGESDRNWLSGFKEMIPAALFGLLAWGLARWRFRDSGKFWPVVLLLLMLPQAAAAGADWLLESRMGGLSIGGFLISTCVDTAALLVLTLLALRVFREPRLAAPAEPRGRVAGVYFRGVFYLITGGIRAGFLLMAADLIWFQGRGGGNPIQMLIENTELGTAGTLLLVLSVVVLAPVGEELLFRGFLLPRLQLQKGPGWAIAVSAGFFALLHPQYGVYAPVVLLYGAVLGWARVRSGGLAAPILLHASINAVAALAMLAR